MAFLSVVTGCYNEEGNALELYERICKTFASDLAQHTFELIVIDNASTDGTVEILKGIAARDKRVQRALRRAGWRVLVVWECQTFPAGSERLEARVRRFLSETEQ